MKPKFGFGLSFSVSSYKDIAGIAVANPSPYFYNVYGTDSGVTGKLKRREAAVNIETVYAPVNDDRALVRIFGGPTHFQYSGDMVSDIGYRQFASSTSRTNIVSITSPVITNAKGGGWGFQTGTDATYFLSRRFGLGAFARFSRGTANVDEPLSESKQNIRVGGFQTGGGVRLRF